MLKVTVAVFIIILVLVMGLYISKMFGNIDQIHSVYFGFDDSKEAALVEEEKFLQIEKLFGQVRNRLGSDKCQELTDSYVKVLSEGGDEARFFRDVRAQLKDVHLEQ